VPDELDTLAILINTAREVTTATTRRLITRAEMRDPEHRARVQRLLDHADPATVAHPQLRIIERHRLSVRRGLSFRAIMVQRSEAARHAGVRDRAWQLDDKAAGYRFADTLGVRRPAGDLTGRPLADIRPDPPCVVKPLRGTGARGVYLVYDHDRIVDVRTGDTVRSWPEAARRAKRLTASTTRPVRDLWIVEELILDSDRPTRDLKFFAFYGQVLFTLEIERLPTFRRVFWAPDGQPVETGKTNTLDDGYGVRPEQVALAERISVEIPAPFMRIDMLRGGGHGAVVGEFTPRPGQFEEFDQATDRQLAEEWMRAERRLLDDALSGKRFAAFEQATDREALQRVERHQAAR
jgi:hypothetical protein